MTDPARFITATLESGERDKREVAFEVSTENKRNPYAEGHIKKELSTKGAEMVEGRDEEDRVARLAAADNIVGYTEYLFHQYKVDKFHKHVGYHLTRLVKGDQAEKNKRGKHEDIYGEYDWEDYQYLMLFAPPQHGKSELVSTRLPTFWLAYNPDLPVALVSYGGKLAERNSRNARAVMRDERFLNIPFDNIIRPDLNNWRVYDWHIHGGRGYVLAVGVGGAITGHGFGLIVIDDPIENWAAAQSDIIRETTWQWWLGTLKTRIWEHGRIVLMMTRWHRDDLAGRILEEEGRVEEGGRWKVLSYPAISMRPTLPEKWEDTEPEFRIGPDILEREVGEPLAPSRFSIDWLEEQRRTITRIVWNAEYQQMPTDPEGEFFKIGRVQIEPIPPADICKLEGGEPVDIISGVRFWDLAATKKSMEARDPDYTSGTLVAESKEDRRFWIIHQYRGQLDPEQVEEQVIMHAKLDGKKVKIRIEQEPGAAGKSLITYYQRLLAGYDVDGYPSSGEPTVKAQSLAGQLNAGNIAMLKSTWNRPMLAEFAGFPNVRHDDQVISASGAFNTITGLKSRFKRIPFKAV
ncbi:MAG: phage terminase large subunit [Candidatus Latescibacteria bacterium]|nr:phage terminase large subunit [Candidatus Latescibacterota bacterium]NIO78680.1 phage terminase large subunit [Candidatus Latescibacterota bacterium]